MSKKISILLFLFALSCSASARMLITNDNKEESPQGRKITVKGIRGSGYWTVKGANYYDENGNRIWFAGVQWTGFEVDGCVHGLWVRNYKKMLLQIKELGFNVIRLSFAGQTLDYNYFPTNINFDLNPDLKGLSSYDLLDKVILAAGDIGLKIILDYHRIRFTSSPEDGLWYDNEYPETVWLQHWEDLAKKYAKNPTVVGFDLFNEVHNSVDRPWKPVWDEEGVDEPFNWRSAVKKAADRIQKFNPDVLIIVEGMWFNSWWSGNLMYFTRVTPLSLAVPNKLVYSAHDYGPNVFDQKRYSPYKGFPNHLRWFWNRRWGYISKAHIAPVWVGEWGSALNVSLISDKTEREVKWAFALRDYIRDLQLSHSWFCFGPDSSDTGGLLQDDWWHVWPEKVKLLAPIMHPNFGPSPGQPDVDDLPAELWD